ncbi:MAG: alginate lyase family protein [Betaproteobacteria bacterium]
MSLSLYLHTLRYLKPVQFYARAVFFLSRIAPDQRSGPPLRIQTCRFPLSPLRSASLIGEETFRFLNESGIVRRGADWQKSDRTRLWQYNLHYFDDLNAVDRESRASQHRRLVTRWIGENPPGIGVGWEPYPLSLRIVNWIKWSSGGFKLTQETLDSLAVQVRFLSRRLEFHLLGNHLFANAKALIFAGAFFEGAEAEKWLDRGLRILDRELTEQILQDGGHFERSPMYHAIIVEDLLDLVALAETFAIETLKERAIRWRPTAKKMLRWLSVMTHPDGRIAFFNDAAFLIAPSRADLEKAAREVGVVVSADLEEGITRLETSGYVKLQSGAATAIVDVAPVGPDYLPGHAHADTLSFELSWNGSRVLTNSGTSTYEPGERRLWERSTAAHNTVVVDGENSSEVWAGFRVARRAYPFDVKVSEDGDELQVAASHDGYRRLSGSPIHRRQITLTRTLVRIKDEINGRGTHQAQGLLHLHPDMQVEQVADDCIQIQLPDGLKLNVRSQGGLKLNLKMGTYAPEFGLIVPRLVIHWTLRGKLPLIAEVAISK